MEHDECREDEEKHRGQGVAAPELDPEVLARQSDDVGDVGHASTSSCVASARRAGSCVATTTVRMPDSAWSSRSSSAAPASSRAEYGSSRTRSSGSWSRLADAAQPLRHPSAEVDASTRWLRASHRGRSASRLRAECRFAPLRTCWWTGPWIEVEVLERRCGARFTRSGSVGEVSRAGADAARRRRRLAARRLRGEAREHAQ